MWSTLKSVLSLPQLGAKDHCLSGKLYFPILLTFSVVPCQKSQHSRLLALRDYREMNLDVYRSNSQTCTYSVSSIPTKPGGWSRPTPLYLIRDVYACEPIIASRARRQHDLLRHGLPSFTIESASYTRTHLQLLVRTIRNELLLNTQWREQGHLGSHGRPRQLRLECRCH